LLFDPGADQGRAADDPRPRRQASRGTAEILDYYDELAKRWPSASGATEEVRLAGLEWIVGHGNFRQWICTVESVQAAIATKDLVVELRVAGSDINVEGRFTIPPRIDAASKARLNGLYKRIYDLEAGSLVQVSGEIVVETEFYNRLTHLKLQEILPR